MCSIRRGGKEYSDQLQGRQARLEARSHRHRRRSATPARRCISGRTRSSSTRRTFSVTAAAARAQGEGRAVPGPAHQVLQRSHRREGRVVFLRRPRRLPDRRARQGRSSLPAEPDHRQERARERQHRLRAVLGSRCGELRQRELRQPDPHGRGRHARQRPALGCGGGGARVLRVPQSDRLAASSSRRKTSGTRSVSFSRSRFTSRSSPAR